MTVRHLGQPCRSRNVLAGRLIVDRGKEFFVLTNMNEAAKMELIFIDIASGKGSVHRAPAGSGSWALNPVADGQLAVGTYYDGTFMLFDVAKRRWRGTAKFPGEDYLWNFATGGDGRLYGGTYPGGKLGALDLATLTVEDCGAPTKALGNQYLRYVSAMPDGRLFAYFGMAKTAMWLYDPKTKAWSEAPPILRDITWGVPFDGHFCAGQAAYKAPDYARATKLPFPIPAESGWAIDVPMSTPERLILRAGRKLWRCKPGDTQLEALPDAPAWSGTLYATGEDGSLYGIRGQDYFVVKPGQPTRLLPIPGQSAPRPTHFLMADAKGRVWGGPTFGQTLFYVDAKSRKATNTRTVSDSGGEVYDAVVVDGVCYAASYAGGEIIRFDPDAPWNQIEHVNPKTIATVAPECIRPTAGIRATADGRLVSGWMARYGEFGGCLAITDPKTGAHDVVQNPLGAWPVATIAVCGDRVFLATGNDANGLPSKNDAVCQIGLFDLAARKVVWRGEVPGARSANHAVWEPESQRVAFVAGGALRQLDLSGPTPKLLPPIDGVKVTSGGMALWKGRIVYGEGPKLNAVRLSDGAVETVGVSPEKIGRIAVGPRGVYTASGVDLYEFLEEKS